MNNIHIGTYLNSEGEPTTGGRENFFFDYAEWKRPPEVPGEWLKIEMKVPENEKRSAPTVEEALKIICGLLRKFVRGSS